MKTIDVKSLIIGALLTSTIFLGVAAVPKDTGKSDRIVDTWDDKQQWAIKTIPFGKTAFLSDGYEPIAFIPNLIKAGDRHFLYRKRIK